MTGVTLIEPDVRMLGRVRIHRNNRFYGFLLSICRLILEATSVKESRDTLAQLNQRFYGAVEKQLPALFEAFVRNYYRKHFGGFGHLDIGQSSGSQLAVGSSHPGRRIVPSQDANRHHA